MPKARGFGRLVHVMMGAVLFGRLVRPHYSTLTCRARCEAMYTHTHTHTRTQCFLAANITITPAQRHISHLMPTECPISLPKGCAPKTSRLCLYDNTSKWQLRTRVSVQRAMHPAIHLAMRFHRCTRDKPADNDTRAFTIIL